MTFRSFWQWYTVVSRYVYNHVPVDWPNVACLNLWRHSRVTPISRKWLCPCCIGYISTFIHLIVARMGSRCMSSRRVWIRYRGTENTLLVPKFSCVITHENFGTSEVLIRLNGTENIQCHSTELTCQQYMFYWRICMSFPFRIPIHTLNGVWRSPTIFTMIKNKLPQNHWTGKVTSCHLTDLSTHNDQLEPSIRNAVFFQSKAAVGSHLT